MKAPAAGNPRYTPYHPKWYRRRMPIFWWLGRLSYTRFITRELTSLAVGYTALLLLVALWALARGEAAWAGFLGRLGHPGWLVFHGFVFLFLLFHTVTWLALAPKALVLRVGRRRLPDGAVVAAHYLAWAATSALVLAFFFLGACEKTSGPDHRASRGGAPGAPASPLAALRLLDVGPATPASPRLARGAPTTALRAAVPTPSLRAEISSQAPGGGG